ncbi:MAG: bifunctional (p)ppGpp synthetase/guanosine-3',5'-bis(diphosphate) 3'-pyrophosphohydrolase [Phycisphaeraceae bacterium]|nr:bifunctional (p)ppGpp synthetase/guanosine-3',5'-bis(diphosphate) 3'-pyrophosphohydrolase [Phycisphaeraceae bacterium]
MPPIGPLWQRAASFAAHAHRSQIRKDNRTPYFAHPVRVAMAVRDVFECRDEIALAAAFLHDTIEDTTTDYDDLAEAFGTEIAACVAALTKNASLPEHVREPAYDRGLAEATWQARLVKLGDVYDNFHDAITTWGIEKIPGKNFERAARALRLAEQGQKDAGGAIERAMAIVHRMVEDARA